MKELILLFLLIGLNAFATDLTVKSDSVHDKKEIGKDFLFNGFGCAGKNLNPELKWTDFPQETKFFAITMFDPDAPTGSGWWHWQIVNIPANVTEIKKGVSGNPKLIPIGSIEMRNDFGNSSYGGPCPPEKDKPHHYILKVYALKDKVPAEPTSSAALVGFYLNSLKIAEGTLIPIYGR